jgi:hypothetical protein
MGLQIDPYFNRKLLIPCWLPLSEAVDEPSRESQVVLVPSEGAILDVVELPSDRESLAEIPIATATNDGCERVVSRLKGLRNAGRPGEKHSFVRILVRESEESMSKNRSMRRAPRVLGADGYEMMVDTEPQKLVRLTPIMAAYIGFDTDPPVETVGS